MAESTHQPQSSAAFRNETLALLRHNQKYLSELKGMVNDNDIVDRFGGPKEGVCDPDTPNDIEAIMNELDDILKQITVYIDKLWRRKHCNFRDSGVSICSDRDSAANMGEEQLSNAVQNEENHDIPGFLTQHGDVARTRRNPQVTGDRTNSTE